ncbi:WD repeat protein [Tritrichomonas foetus]|uniref:WD repeat protein n=1 Tax=Tritrichomonas foetus TaxID=1144522 RepID=A0A1J4JHJ1_9EUKA|nr:WD repeat protein [Tritrichomonas foetus]|eukprot:OHS97711.1 WD repeat protein [Tritrichomonas foetus]
MIYKIVILLIFSIFYINYKRSCVNLFLSVIESINKRMSTKFRVFLSKRMKSATDNPMTVIAWNRTNRILACGYHNGMVNLYLVNPSRDQPGTTQVENVQPIEYHKKPITALTWSDNGQFLSSGDSSGRVAFWNHPGKVWKHCLTNSSVASSVCSIRWNKRSDMTAIAYADSTVACVSPAGELSWSNTMRQPIDFVEWTLHGGNLLCGTSYGEIMIVDNRGVETGTVPMPCLANANTEPKIIALEWHRKAPVGLLIAYQGGQIQLMRNEQDTQPIVITCELELTAATWFKSGTAFAVAGVKTKDRCNVLFFNAKGDAIRELDVSGSRIGSMSLDPNDTQLALSIENIFCLAQIIPTFIWAFTKNTLLYAYNNSDSDDYTVIYYNYKTDDKRVHTISDVVSVAGHSGNFVVVSKGKFDDSTVYVTDTIGVSIGTTTIPYVPTNVAIFGKTIALCSSNQVSVWRFEEEDQPQTINFSDNISALHLREKQVTLSVGSSLVVLDIPSLAEVSRFSVGFTPESITSSSDGSTLALTDSSGTLQFFSTGDQKIIGPARREVWNAAWSADTPTQFAASERQKLFVYNNLEPEEPLQSLSHIAQFSDLEILCVDLIRLMQDPISPVRRLFKSYPTKALRELRTMLTNRPAISVDDILNYAKEQHKNKLWDELAETFMVEMNFTLAEKCYLETTNYRGLQFLKRIRSLKDANIQRAQVLSYLGRFDEAQSIYNSMDRLDLAIEMRASIGDFERVIDIIGPNSVGNDESIAKAYSNVGDTHAEASEWVAAAEHYALAGDDAKYATCLYLSDDFPNLERLLNKLPSTSPLLPVLGRMFVSIGAVDAAVTAFTDANDPASAIDACARLNHWKPALKLAGKGKSEEIRMRMNQYASQLIENGQTAAAIDFYARAGLGVEAAKLMEREGDNILKLEDDYLSAKMCFVFAGLQLEKHRKGAFDGSITAAERLDGLMKEDEAATSGLLDSIWRKAEAIHFYMMAHRYMQHRKWLEALFCACRVFDDYANVVGEDKAAALLAICGIKTRHYGQCSRAMTTLEHFDDYSEEKRNKFADLAIDIFVKNPPQDPVMLGSVPCHKCDAKVSMLKSQCPECGARMKVCVKTGGLILDNSYWECKYCRHCVVIDLADDLTVCPLCHHQTTA